MIPKTLWKDHRLRLALALLGAVGVFYGAKNWRIVRLAHAQVTAVPFVVQQEITRPTADGGAVVLKRRTVARRSDGSTALVESAGPVSAGQFARKIVFLDGRSLSLVDALRARSTWPMHRPEEIALLKARLSAKQRDCMPSGGATFLRFDNINGEEVAVIQMKESGFRLTRWLALRLGCEPLYYQSERLHSDGTISVEAESKTVALQLGEPDARYFDPGAEYAELKPSEIQSRSFGAAGIVEPQDQKDRVRRLDEKYAGGR